MHQVTPSPLSIPFAHWHLLSTDALLQSPVTTAAYLRNRLVCGQRSGDILIFDAPTDTNQLFIRNILVGHTAPIVSLELLTLCAETGLASEEEHFLLGLSTDGQLTKWSLKSGRCLQSMRQVVPFKPHGLRVVTTGAPEANGNTGGRFLRTTYIFIYGSSTDVLVLDAFTLRIVLIWNRNADWPVPLHYRSKGDYCHILTAMEDGAVESWTFKGLPAANIQKNQDVSFNVKRPELGNLILLAAGCKQPRISVVQKHGISVWDKIQVDDSGNEEWCIIYQQKFEHGVLDAHALSANSITIWTDKHTVLSFVWDEAESGFIESVGSLPCEAGQRICGVAVPSFPGSSWVAFLSSLKGNTFSISSKFQINSKDNSEPKQIIWAHNVLPSLSSEKLLPASCAASSSSAIFHNMLLFACGKTIRFYSLSTFLLSFEAPAQILEIPQCSGKIVLLKTVRLRDPASAFATAEKEFLILGTSLGEIRIIQAPDTVSSKIPISTAPLNSASKLPSDLGERLRNTLLVTAIDGTAAILDVERAKVLAVFPGHDHKDVTKFSTKEGENLLKLGYSDGVSREWEFGDDECAVLIGPHSHHNSKPSSREGHVPLPVSAPPAPWRETLVADYWRKDEDVFDVENLKVFSICDVPSHKGVPTAAVNLRHVLGAVVHSNESNPKGRNALPRDHPALVTARAVLISLLPNVRQIFRYVMEDAGSSELLLDSETLDDLFPHSPSYPTLGQIGSGGNISLISPYLVQKTKTNVVAEGLVGGILNISPTVTAIGQLCILAIAKTILESVGKAERFTKVASVLLVGKSDKAKRPDGFIPPSLGVVAKFWLDPMPAVRYASEYIMEAYMSGLTDDHRRDLASFWQEFLPVNVDPQLVGTAKQIPRSVVVLTFLLATKPLSNYAKELPEMLSRSFEIMLEASSPDYYKLLAASLLSAHWILFQANFHDPVARLQTLILLPEMAPSLAQISKQNYPLLMTAFTSLFNAASNQIPILRTLLSVVMLNPPPFQLISTFLLTLCRFLELSHHHLQRDLQSVVQELCVFIGSMYPQASFEPAHHRLATSTQRGVVSVHDMKTGVCTFRLEGHVGIAYALKWGGEGMRMLAAIDVEDAMVVVWKVSSGFLSSFMGREGDDGSQLVAPRGKWRIGKGGKILEWHGEKAIVILRESGEEVRVNIG